MPRNTYYPQQLANQPTVIVWSDSGLSQPPFTQPFLDKQDGDFVNEHTEIKWCPTILNRHPAESNLEAYEGRQHNITRNIAPTLGRLSESYGWTLPALLASKSPFLACLELYQFMLVAELQFANMMDQILQQQLQNLTLLTPASKESTRTATAADLAYNQSILESHLARITDCLQSIENGVPEALVLEADMDAETQRDTARARADLVRDLCFVRSRLKSCIRQCERGSAQVASNLALREAQWANDQSGGLAKLAKLGTWFTVVYVPLSFVTTIFGMNVSQFDQGPISIWIWAVVSGPVLAVSLLIFGLSEIKARLKLKRGK